MVWSTSLVLQLAGIGAKARARATARARTEARIKARAKARAKATGPQAQRSTGRVADQGQGYRATGPEVHRGGGGGPLPAA
jgi:hypothetical protein